MRRFSLMAMAMVLAVTTLACGDDGGEDVGEDVDTGAETTNPAGATTAPVPSTAAGSTIARTELTLRIADARLTFSEEPDRGMRVLLPQGVATAAVTITGLASPNRTISVCQATALEGQSAGNCRSPQSGTPVTVTLGSAARGVEIVQDAPSASGSDAPTVLEEVAIRYTATSREVNVRLPQIASGEPGGRPTFSLTPPSTDGAYRATFTWRVILVFGGTPASAQLELLQGGSPVNQAQGGGDVRFNGTVPTPGTEASIRAQNLGGSALVTPQLSLLLP